MFCEKVGPSMSFFFFGVSCFPVSGIVLLAEAARRVCRGQRADLTAHNEGHPAGGWFPQAMKCRAKPSEVDVRCVYCAS